MTSDQIVSVAVAVLTFGTAAFKAVSEILSSRNPQEKTLAF